MLGYGDDERDFGFDGFDNCGGSGKSRHKDSGGIRPQCRGRGADRGEERQR